MLVHPQFDPILVSLGPVAIRWYGLMYVLAFVAFIMLGKWRVRHGLGNGLTERDVDLPRLRAGLRAALLRTGLADPEVDVDAVSSLPRHPETGKLRRVIPA